MSYTISQVEELTGISAYTLRYYDKLGLLPFVDRTNTGNRCFKDADFKYLNMITCLKETGMPLAEIGQFIDWCMAGDTTLNERRQMFTSQVQAVEAQIADLQANLRKLEYKQKYYETAVKYGTEAVIIGDCEFPDIPLRIDQTKLDTLTTKVG
ncbi:MerR family transcriptional regulator [Periweissella cryptocerci]|uniref:MerR family transcriptional regulator n=1 Tax=Periweissella cryptocerci TaxID=2506420 RepID=A0A4V1AIR9_9LACO|nr:MerR family transcriptional regulator [Periweissella cryptocerci]QBO36465.1 MerR family transcriptional regulator [Periweissella cryptocerci]